MRIQHTLTLMVTKMGIQLFRGIPFFGLYLLSDVMCIMLNSVLRYRKKVVYDNLKASFPSLSEGEIQEICSKFYRNLCDITLESVKGLTMSRESLKARYQIANPEILDAPFHAGKSVILAGSHYGNWEWGVRSWSLWFRHKVLGIYKPLANKTVEAYLNARREDFGMQLVGPKETRASLQKSTVEPCIFVLFGDQNPHNLNTCHWVPFLNRDTAWLQGVAEISHQQDFQVFYLKTKRVKRGFYVSVILPLELQPKIADPLEISATYARRVEADVLEQPEDWLWSHKRWKHKR